MLVGIKANFCNITDTYTIHITPFVLKLVCLSSFEFNSQIKLLVCFQMLVSFGDTERTLNHGANKNNDHWKKNDDLSELKTQEMAMFIKWSCSPSLTVQNLLISVFKQKYEKNYYLAHVCEKMENIIKLK